MILPDSKCIHRCIFYLGRTDVVFLLHVISTPSKVFIGKKIVWETESVFFFYRIFDIFTIYL